MMLSVTSCAESGHVKPVVIDTTCDWVTPIYLAKSEIDVMTAESLRQILAHNETWQKKCSNEVDTRK